MDASHATRILDTISKRLGLDPSTLAELERQGAREYTDPRTGITFYRAFGLRGPVWVTVPEE